MLTLNRKLLNNIRPLTIRGDCLIFGFNLAFKLNENEINCRISHDENNFRISIASEDKKKAKPIIKKYVKSYNNWIKSIG